MPPPPKKKNPYTTASRWFPFQYASVYSRAVPFFVILAQYERFAQIWLKKWLLITLLF